MNLREQRMIQHADNHLNEAVVEFILGETRSALADWDRGEMALSTTFARIAVIGTLANECLGHGRVGWWRKKAPS